MEPWKKIFPAAAGIAAVSEDGEQSENPLNFIDVTGAPGTGKTTFGMRAIGRQKGLANNPIVVFDIEGGAKPYKNQFAIDIVDLDTSEKEQAWIKFDKAVSSMKKGQYALAIIDPIEDLESCLMDYVLANPKKFNKTEGQYKTAAGVSGLFWGDVKTEAKRALLLLSQKVQTVIMVRHTGAVYQGNKIVPGKLAPKGKDIITKLSSLSLWFVSAENGGAPSAFVKKSRLSWVDQEDVDDYGVAKTYPVMPNFIPIATPQAIRDYLTNPRKKFTDQEMTNADPANRKLSEEEILAMRQDVLESEANLLKEAKTARKLNLLNKANAVFESKEAIAKAVATITEQGFSFDLDEESFAAALMAEGRRINAEKNEA